MTYVFQHKEKKECTKMIEANNLDEAYLNLSKRLAEGYVIRSGRKNYDSFNEFELDFLM